MNCPACLSSNEALPVEEHTDPVHGTLYSLWECPDCRVTFSQPRDPVHPSWYSKSRMNEARAGGSDWRYRTFFSVEREGSRLLDVGCGAGQFLRLAQDRGFQVVGVDYNPAHVEEARKAGLVNVEAQDYGTYLRSHAAKYDVVTLFDVLEHVGEPAVLLQAVRAALAPSGRLIVTLPNNDRPLLSKSNREKWDYPPYHYTRWTQRALKKVLERLGYEILRTDCSTLPFGFYSGLLYFRLLQGLFPRLKQLLLGTDPRQAQKTWTELLGQDGGACGSRTCRGWLASERVRSFFVQTGNRAFFLLALPIEVPIILAMRWARSDSGRTLYVEARARP